MEEILHHLGCVNLVNNGINYISTGAGFQPSTVSFVFIFLDQTSPTYLAIHFSVTRWIAPSLVKWFGNLNTETLWGMSTLDQELTLMLQVY